MAGIDQSRRTGARGGRCPAPAEAALAPSPRRVRVPGRPAGTTADRRAGTPAGDSALPAQTTRLIGRERETARVCELLRRVDVRLVTLVGPPGIGKTRLALAVAETARADFADGVVFAPLAPLRDPELVVSAIAGPVGVRELGGRPLFETLATALSRRQLLLVLDNFEHLLDAAAVVADLLAACPGLAVLATSRAPLRLYGERELPVPPLGLPDPAHLPPPDEVAGFSAVALFVERARAVRQGFGLTPENAATVAELCGRLDGLPLAIELAAARVKLLAPAAILERLDRRLELLTTGARDMPERHQTLRAAVDWSYDLLSESERALLRRLAVFAGGWTLDAAEAVCADGERHGEGSGQSPARSPSDILELLGRLVDRSLVQADERAGEVRYRLLESIREYAEARLREAGEESILRDRHLNWFLGLAERAEPGLWGGEQLVWLGRLETEIDNLRAALVWSRQRPERAAGGLRLVATLWRFWDVGSHPHEGRAWLAGLRPLVPGSTTVHAKAMFAEGYLATMQGDPPGIAILEDGVALSRELGDEDSLVLALCCLGLALDARGDGARAEVVVEEAVDLARRLGREVELNVSLYHFANILVARGEHERAEALLEECRILGRRRQDRWGDAYPLIGLAFLAWRRSDYDRSTALLEESLRLRQELGDKRGIAHCLESLGWVAEAQGQAERAARLLGAVSVLEEELGGTIPMFWGRFRGDVAKAARAALGEEAFATAWAEGRAMPLEDAVTYALAPEEPTSPAGPGPNAAGSPARGPLTPREREVAALVARGLTNRQIAGALVIAERTADTHVGNILGKLDLATRAQVAAWAVEQGLLTLRRD